jgi:hypothetical protein
MPAIRLKTVEELRAKLSVAQPQPGLCDAAASLC